MVDSQPGPGWWLASDGRWYPPEARPGPPPPPPFSPQPTFAQPGGAAGMPAPRGQVPQWLVIVGIVVIIGGAITLFSLALLRNRTPSNQTAHTTGTVTGCINTDTGNINTAIFTVDGQRYTAQTRFGTRTTCTYAVGATVTVTYDPSDPSSASVPVSSSFDFHGIAPLILGLGILATIIGVGRILFAQRRARRNSAGP